MRASQRRERSGISSMSVRPGPSGVARRRRFRVRSSSSDGVSGDVSEDLYGGGSASRSRRGEPRRRGREPSRADRDWAVIRRNYRKRSPQDDGFMKGRSRQRRSTKRSLDTENLRWELTRERARRT